MKPWRGVFGKPANFWNGITFLRNLYFVFARDRGGLEWDGRLSQGVFQVSKKEDLSRVQGVILYKDRVVIPKRMRREILEGLHAGHQEVVSMRARAATWVF